MKKVALLLLAIILMTCLVACGGEETPPVETIQPDNTPIEEPYNPLEDKIKIKNSINDFFQNQIKIKEMFNKRAVISKVKVTNALDSKDTSVDPDIKQILISGNIAQITYNNPKLENGFLTTSEYIVTQNEGAYAIKTNGTEYMCEFDQFYLINPGDIPVIPGEQVLWDATSKVFVIHSDYLKSFVKKLLTNTQFLENFNRTYTDEEVENLIKACTMSMFIKVDEKTGEVTEINFTSDIKQNGMDKRVVNFNYKKFEQNIEFVLEYMLEGNMVLKGTITTTDDINYNITIQKTEYSLFNTKASDIKYQITLNLLEEDPISIQNNVEEMMIKCDRIVSQYNSVISGYNKKYANYYNCKEVFIYNERHRVYMRFTPDEDNQLVFTNVVLNVDESVICLASIEKNSLTFSHHCTEEQWLGLLSTKYVNLMPCNNTSDNCCTQIALYDNEYEKYILFQKTPDGYKYIEYIDELDEFSPYFCTAIIKNGIMEISRHSQVELFYNSILNNPIRATNRKAQCSQIYVTKFNTNFIFSITPNNDVIFIGTSPYINGCCRASYDTEKNLLSISSHTKDHK